MLSWESLYSIKVGGVAPCVSEISEALARRDHEVHVFTRRGDFESYDKINGVHYQRVDVNISGDVLAQMNNMCDALYDRFGAVQRLFGRFDIMHGHDWHPVNALTPHKAGLWSAFPSDYAQHGMGQKWKPLRLRHISGDIS